MQILTLQLNDTLLRYELGSDGEYHKVSPKDGGLSSQDAWERMTTQIYNANKEIVNKKIDEKMKRLVTRMMGES